MIYHAVNKSIANFRIFNNAGEFERIIQAIRYYRIENQAISFSRYLKENKTESKHIERKVQIGKICKKLVEIIAYCIMPTHVHFMLEPLKEDGIAVFMNNLLNSYTRYFNLRHKRKGPLWESRTKKVEIETDDQLIHVTRYIHLNPVTAHIVEKPEEWPYSSYREYTEEVPKEVRICLYAHVLDIKHGEYRKFVEAGISYQRELADAKKIFLE